MNTSTPFTVTIVIDKTAALLAGVDAYGLKTIEVTPSTLTARQRQTLDQVNFSITGSTIGGAISGLESIEDLLDRAALEMEA